MKAGRRLEKVIHYIESVVSGCENVTVESPKRLQDKTNGTLREHDVVVTVRLEHDTLIIALECRDRKRPVGVPDVEAFSQKCLNTSVNKGVFVSNTGFCGTAIDTARALGIECRTVDQLEDVEWFVGPKLMIGIHRQLTSANLTFQHKEGTGEDSESFVIVNAEGKTVSPDDLKRYANGALDRCAMEHTPGEYTRRVDFNVKGLRIRLNAPERLIPVHRIIGELTYTISKTVQPLEMSRYQDAETGSPVSEFATARLDLGGLAGQIIMAGKPDRSISVGFVPDDAPRKKRAAQPESGHVRK